VSYTVGYIEVFLNGVFLNASDYTATNGTSVVLAVAASAGDIVEVVAIGISFVSGLSVTGTPVAGQYATFVNATTVQGTTGGGGGGGLLTAVGYSITAGSSITVTVGGGGAGGATNGGNGSEIKDEEVGGQ
jgi:hypothetical protein